MAGPPIMALGGFTFVALGFSFTDMGDTRDTRWAEIGIAGGFNRIQWTGGTGDFLTINGVLFPVEFGGDGSLEGIRSAAQSGQPLPLVSLGDGASINIFQHWVVESVTRDSAYIDSNGTPRRLAYTIDLRAYEGGSFTPASVITLF